MHHYGVAARAQTPEQRAHPALTDLHVFGSFPLGSRAFVGLFQPIQIISFLLAHRDSFHFSALRLSIGTFYLAQLGTFHLAATAPVRPPVDTPVRSATIVRRTFVVRNG